VQNQASAKISPAATAEAGSRPRLGPPTLTAFGLGTFAMSVNLQALGPMLLFYFNQVVGLPAAWVGAAIAIGIAIDAVTDLMIGYTSDNWRSRWGRRHPFMYAAALPAAIAFYCLFTPPTDWGQDALFYYMLFAMIAARITISFYDLMSTALGAELTSDYDERTKLVAYRLFFGSLSGTVVGYLTYSTFLQPTEQYTVGQLNPDGYGAFAIFAAISIIASILIANIGTHHFIPFLYQPERKPLNLIVAVKEVFETVWNRNYIVLLFFGIFSGVSVGLDTGLRLYFSTYFYQLSADQLSQLVLGAALAPFLAAFISPMLGRRFGKKHLTVGAWFLSLFIGFVPLWLWSFDLLPPKESPWLMVIMIADLFVVTTLLMVGFIQGASMAMDLTEEVQVKTGRRSEGVLGSAAALVQKMITGLGGLLAGLILAWVGFPEKAVPGEVDPAILTNLAWIFLPTTTLLNILAVGTLLFYSNDRTQHEAYLRALNEADRRSFGADKSDTTS
jgi:glycoside/pentoside/hexuronide:cation symporter, GPH family